jgi:uncharacterized protein YbaP (TraB family)
MKVLQANDGFLWAEEIDFYDSELLHDTLTEMEVGDNEGNSTIELYCEKDTDLIYENSEEILTKL